MVSPESGYAPVAVSIVLMGAGIGTAMAPATAAIMGSVPIEHASVGSAMNDTTRMVGGAFGVAILGSVLASGYTNGLEGHLDGLPAESADVAESSVGGAAVLASKLPEPAGDALTEAANAAFVSGMASAALVAAGIAALGALIAALWLPSSDADIVLDTATQDERVGRVESLAGTHAVALSEGKIS
jgi:hypothetical protein